MLMNFNSDSCTDTIHRSSRTSLGWLEQWLCPSQRQQANARARASSPNCSSPEFKIINAAESERVFQAVNITHRTDFRVEFSQLSEAYTLELHSQLRARRH
jgi:hypothetical protein